MRRRAASFAHFFSKDDSPESESASSTDDLALTAKKKSTQKPSKELKKSLNSLEFQLDSGQKKSKAFNLRKVFGSSRSASTSLVHSSEPNEKLKSSPGRKSWSLFRSSSHHKDGSSPKKQTAPSSPSTKKYRTKKLSLTALSDGDISPKMSSDKSKTKSSPKVLPLHYNQSHLSERHGPAPAAVTLLATAVGCS